MQRELTKPQKNLIAMLVQHEHRIPVAAQQVGVPAKTAQTWMNLPYMREAFDTARRETADKLIEECQSGNYDGLPAPAVQVFSALALHPKEQAIAAQRYISQMQLYRDLPINKVLTWK